MSLQEDPAGAADPDIGIPDPDDAFHDAPQDPDRTTVWQPTPPIMGGNSQTGPKIIEAWTGGKPKADWSGLEDPSTGHTSPSQIRPYGSGSSLKSHIYRQKGLAESPIVRAARPPTSS